MRKNLLPWNFLVFFTYLPFEMVFIFYTVGEENFRRIKNHFNGWTTYKTQRVHDFNDYASPATLLQLPSKLMNAPQLSRNVKTQFRLKRGDSTAIWNAKSVLFLLNLIIRLSHKCARQSGWQTNNRRFNCKITIWSWEGESRSGRLNG